MALPNPTTLVGASLTLSLSDIVTGVTTLNRVVPSVLFKSLNVQYQGNINLAPNTSTTIAPVPPVTTFAVVYVRNIGGQGSGNVVVIASTNVQPNNVVTLDVGAMFLYISPLLSSIAVTAVIPGIVQFQVNTALTTSSNVEVLAAG